MRRKWILLMAVCSISFSGYSQQFAIKSNLLYDATTTINIGVEFALADQWTLDISANYNPWSFLQKESVIDGVTIPEHEAKIKHWMLQPELRRWICEEFDGHYFGLYGQYGQFNIGGLTFLPDGFADGFTDSNGTHHNDGAQYKRFQGWMIGAGLSYGYHWILSNRFSLEFSIGLGYAHMSYDKFGIQICDPKESTKYMNYWGPTKLGITAMFMLK